MTQIHPFARQSLTLKARTVHFGEQPPGIQPESTGDEVVTITKAKLEKLEAAQKALDEQEAARKAQEKRRERQNRMLSRANLSLWLGIGAGEIVSVIPSGIEHLASHLVSLPPIDPRISFFSAVASGVAVGVAYFLHDHKQEQKKEAQAESQSLDPSPPTTSEKSPF
jgi:hypothetical protein